MRKIAFFVLALPVLFGCASSAAPARRADTTVRLVAYSTPKPVMQLLISLCPAAYLEGDLFAWILLRLTVLSMRGGVCDLTAFVFSAYGMVVTEVLGRREEGALFGKLALALEKRLPNRIGIGGE